MHPCQRVQPQADLGGRALPMLVFESRGDASGFQIQREALRTFWNPLAVQEGSIVVPSVYLIFQAFFIFSLDPEGFRILFRIVYSRYSHYNMYFRKQS